MDGWMDGWMTYTESIADGSVSAGRVRQLGYMLCCAHFFHWTNPTRSWLLALRTHDTTVCAREHTHACARAHPHPHVCVCVCARVRVRADTIRYATQWRTWQHSVGARSRQSSYPSRYSDAATWVYCVERHRTMLRPVVLCHATVDLALPSPPAHCAQLHLRIRLSPM
jgi:hypothetical protein